MQSLPTPREHFEIQLSYAHGIGLHAVVNVATLNAATIGQIIVRFLDLGETNWVAY